MRKKTKLLISAMCICVLWPFFVSQAYASDGEYITISVDATDDNDGLKYALDTDDPEAFTDSNEFTILAGTEHTIYVRDAAGNITSQTYKPSQAEPESMSSSVTVTDFSQDLQEDGQQINIDLEIDRQREIEEPYSDYEYLTDDPVEAGTGTVAEKIKTDGTETSDRIFYTFTTKEGEVLYLIIDQSRSENNVYLLDTVSADDLLVLAEGSTGKEGEAEKEDNLLVALKGEAEESAKEEDKKTSSSNSSNLFIALFFVLIGGGAYYYFKIYKNKKDEAMDVMDAMEMEDFGLEEDPDEEEADFEYDEKIKEEYLAELINEEDEKLYDADPEEYAASESNPEEFDGDYGFNEEELEGDDI